VATPPSSSPPPADTPSVPKLAHSLTLSSGAVFAVSVVTQVLGLIATIFLAHLIGITHAGVALLGTAQFFLLIASSINGLADLRLGTAYTYFLARGKPARSNTSTYLVIGLAMDAAAVIAVFVVAPVEFGGASLVRGTSEWIDLGLFLTLPILWSFSGLYNNLYIGLGNSLRAQYPTLVEGLVRLAALVYVAFYVRSIEGIAVAYVLGAIASAIFSLPALRPQLAKFHWSEATQMFRYSWPLLGALFINYVVTNLTPFLVVSLSKFELAVFFAANGWRILVLSLPAAVTTPLFPYIAGLHRSKKFEAVRRTTWQALRYSAMLLVPGVVALVTYRSTFLNVFTTRLYVGPGSLPLAILAAGALPLAFSQIIQSSINAIGRQRLELYITIAQVVVLFAAQAALFPQNGIFPIFWKIIPTNLDPGLVAASVAILLSSIAALALNTYFMERLIRVHLQPGPILSIIGSAAGAFTVFWILNHAEPFPALLVPQYAKYWFLSHLQSFPVSSWYELLSVVILGFVTYFLILASVGELTRSDVRKVGSSMGLPAWLYEPVTVVCWKESSRDLDPIDLSTAWGFQTTELPETFTGTLELPGAEPFSPDAEDDASQPPTAP
jgi:O-antigen/teichoic acid export membrane protein